jgi:hypothetical protein
VTGDMIAGQIRILFFKTTVQLLQTHGKKTGDVVINMQD